MSTSLAATGAAPASSALRTETITTEAGLRALAPEWDALLDAAGVDHPFLTLEWLSAWWECCGAGRRLRLVTVRDATGLVAAAPLMLGRRRLGGLPVRHLESLGDVHAQRGDLIVARGRAEAYEAIWSAVRSTAEWDVLLLRQVPAGSPTLGALPDLARRDRMPFGAWHSGDAPYLPVAGAWDVYLNGLRPKHRANLRNREGRLRRMGAVCTETIASEAALEEALADGFRIEAAAWKGKAGSAIAARPELRRLYAEFARRAARRGWLRLRFLTVDGRRIAFDFAVRRSGREYLLKPGYDPAYAALAPHTLLCAAVLREAFDDGLGEYDFLGGADPWKLQWTTHSRPHSWLYAFAPTRRGRLLHRLKFEVAPRLRNRARPGPPPVLADARLMAPAPRPVRAAGPFPGVARTYVPSWPGLTPGDFARRPAAAPPFPFDAPERIFFYRARHALYHLFRALELQPGDSVLAPDYHSGSEVAAMRAAGAEVRFFRIDRDGRPDLDQIERLCRSGPRALLTIHYLGWPQPVAELAAICRSRGILLVEDCALSLLSRAGDRPLGTFGDFAVFCLYKTLAVPHGGLLVQNGAPLPALQTLKLSKCGVVSTAGRTAELVLERLRARFDRLGRGLFAAKRAIGRGLGRLPVKRLPVGDIGFSLDDVENGMSALCAWLAARADHDAIRARRRANFERLRRGLEGIPLLFEGPLAEGICPLFLPLLVPDKPAAARAMRRSGIEAVEFWNDGDPRVDGEGARFLRRHVLELPIHQDVTSGQIDSIAACARAVLKSGARALLEPGARP